MIKRTTKALDSTKRILHFSGLLQIKHWGKLKLRQSDLKLTQEYF